MRSLLGVCRSLSLRAGHSVVPRFCVPVARLPKAAAPVFGSGSFRGITDWINNKLLDELWDKMQDIRHGSKGWRPATSDKVDRHHLANMGEHLATRNQLDALQMVQKIQVVAPYVAAACKELSDLVFKDYPALHMNDLYREHEEMTHAFRKLQNIDPSHSQLHAELDTLTQRYFEFGLTAMRIMEEYNSYGRLRRWYYSNDTQRQLESLMEQYKFFLQSFSAVLQIDSRLAMHSEFAVVNRAVHNISARIEDFVSALGRLEAIGGKLRDDIRSAKRDMSQGFQSAAREQQAGFKRMHQNQCESERNIKSNMDSNHGFLVAGMDYLVRQNTQILQHQSRTFDIIEKMQAFQEEQGRFIMERVKEQGNLVQRQMEIIERLSGSSISSSLQGSP